MTTKTKGKCYMAQFTNQAQLSYNNIVTVSNIAVGEIQDVLSISKTAVKDVYKANDTITYVINIINSGNSELNNLTLTDSLGEYSFGQTKLLPLTYVDNTLRYFKNNVLQAQPVVTAENNLVVLSDERQDAVAGGGLFGLHRVGFDACKDRRSG